MLAQNYFIESVELGYCGFIGKKCESWTYFLKQKCADNEVEFMGEPVSQRLEVLFVVGTRMMEILGWTNN